MPVSTAAVRIDTPIGTLSIEGTEAGVHVVRFAEDSTVSADQPPAALLTCADQLAEYFAGIRRSFRSIALCSVGTDFQQRVWDAAAEIGWGETATYADIAAAVGSAEAVRAVGTALGRNPLCIVVPCHRVITSQGAPGGYAGGAWRKEWLLRHEAGDPPGA